MTQLNEEHFEVIDKNKDERYQRQRVMRVEDRLKVLEKSIESHAKILARFQMTEGDQSWNIAKGQNAILTIRVTGNEGQKETKKTKLEV
jgi:hypothetical protein